jgi:manganese/zinc/iron transport system permease protein
MSEAQLEIQAIAVVTAVACALPGSFLVLRRMALMADAISHSILLGIVLAFFVVGSVGSPLLIVGAAVMGIVTVVLVETLANTKLVGKDAAIGLVFPALFSIAVILIARFADDVHLDVDAVLLGELAFAPFERFVVNGYDLGPRALWVMGVILVVNVAGLALFYKELKVATFDAALAAALGFSPVLVHYGLMGAVSVTAVGAFDAVGSVLVVALMIAPPATAYLLTDRLSRMVATSALLGAITAVGGFWLAHLLDASIAGSMATTAGFFFGLAFLFARDRGLVALLRRRKRQRWEFAQEMLVVHLLHHEYGPDAAEENRVAHLQEGLRWESDFTDEVVGRASRRGLVQLTNGLLTLTDEGRDRARRSFAA